MIIRHQHQHHHQDHYHPLTRTLRREDREGRRLVFDVSRGDPVDTLYLTFVK